MVDLVTEEENKKLIQPRGKAGGSEPGDILISLQRTVRHSQEQRTERAKKEKRMKETLKDEMNVKRFCRSRRHIQYAFIYSAV